MSDLKPTYRTPTEESALAVLDRLEEKCGAQYPSVMYKYLPEIRSMIYTTNAIENFNRQLRKSTKTKGAFVSDDALMKRFCLTTMQVTEK